METGMLFFVPLGWGQNLACDARAEYGLAAIAGLVMISGLGLNLSGNAGQAELRPLLSSTVRARAPRSPTPTQTLARLVACTMDRTDDSITTLHVDHAHFSWGLARASASTPSTRTTTARVILLKDTLEIRYWPQDITWSLIGWMPIFAKPKS
jgi:hypothetical protein